MPDPIPFQARALAPHDLPDALRLAQAAGLHGIYVANALAADLAGSPAEGQSVGLFSAHGLSGLLWFGDRGNLIVVHDAELDPARVALTIGRRGIPWRIALGPPTTIGALVREQNRVPIVDREQIYYGVRDPGVAAGDPPEGPEEYAPRPAVMADLPMLMEAALALNESDLGVPPERVDRSWLRATIANRIRERSTRVIGPEGTPWCKLDFGSLGREGLMVEGIHTAPERRCQGLATRLLGDTARRQLLAGMPVICLHVAADNLPARRSYEKAGLVQDGSCRILLLP